MAGVSDLKLGELVEGHQERDAIHIAVAPVIAGENLNPGNHVALENGVAVEAIQSVGAVGIVDPFLRKMVKKGQKFWLFMYQNTITSLRHEWVHPAFPDGHTLALAEALSGNREWLQDFAEKHEVSYDKLMAAAHDYLRDGSLTHIGTDISYEDMESEFWDRFESVTGIKVSNDKRGSIFSCAC